MKLRVGSLSQRNEVGNAEFSDLANAPVPHVTGSVSYEGRVRGGSGGNSYEAMSSFAGPLGGNRRRSQRSRLHRHRQRF